MMKTDCIDWEKIWEDIYDERSAIMRRDYQVHDWSERSEDYSESRRSNEWDYGRNVADILKRRGIISSSSEVLEIGSGPGTFVIPFSPHVRNYTAIEPADGMIEKIRENATQAGIKNYEIIRKIWQDVDVRSDEKRYDLVISSTVIWMFRDIMDQIKRMEQICRGRCCIVAGFGNSDPDELALWKSVMGDIPYPVYPEYPYIYNILYQNGRVPNVEMITSSSTRSAAMLMNMYRVFYSIYTDFSPEIEEKVNKHLLSREQTLPEGPRIVRRYRSAVIWWDPVEKQPGFTN